MTTTFGSEASGFVVKAVFLRLRLRPSFGEVH
jgi:hypothetical protein